MVTKLYFTSLRNGQVTLWRRDRYSDKEVITLPAEDEEIVEKMKDRLNNLNARVRYDDAW